MKTGEAPASLSLGTKALVQERVRNFFARLSHRGEEVKRQRRTVLQARVEERASALVQIPKEGGPGQES